MPVSFIFPAAHRPLPLTSLRHFANGLYLFPLENITASAELSPSVSESKLILPLLWYPNTQIPKSPALHLHCSTQLSWTYYLVCYIRADYATVLAFVSSAEIRSTAFHWQGRFGKQPTIARTLQSGPLPPTCSKTELNYRVSEAPSGSTTA